LIERAYRHYNASRHLLVKGVQDLIADESGIMASVSEPVTEALEAISGTGDIITGLLAGLVGIGRPVPEACIAAARISRLAGQAVNPDPGTYMAEIIRYIPDARDRVEKNGDREAETSGH